MGPAGLVLDHTFANTTMKTAAWTSAAACRASNARSLVGGSVSKGAVRKVGERTFLARALGGEPEGGSTQKRKFITREEEPEEYWRSRDEREGKSPLQDPLAISILVGMSVPFVILAIGIATGYIETGN